MDNLSQNQEKSLTGATIGSNALLKGWVEGDNKVYHNLNHFLQIKMGKDAFTDNWCAIGSRIDDTEVYIKDFQTLDDGFLWLTKTMEKKNDS